MTPDPHEHIRPYLDVVAQDFADLQHRHDVLSDLLASAEAKLRAVEKLMAATITPSGGEGVVTVADLRIALAGTTPEPVS